MPTRLLDSSNNVHSQCGQDGVLAKLFELMGIQSGYCVEFGAWDGVYLSNTRNLLKTGHWGGCLIELDNTRFQQVSELYKERDDVSVVQKAVGIGDGNSLDDILDSVNAPESPDFVSIDIDSDDYHVWNALTRHSPKVVLIETNPYIPFYIEFIQAYQSNYMPTGASALSLFLLGRRKGYTAVAYVGHDWLFVRDDLVQDLDLHVPSYVQMMMEGSEIRNNELLTIGNRLHLPTGLAGDGSMNINEEFTHKLCGEFSPDNDSHFKILTCLRQFEGLA